MGDDGGVPSDYSTFCDTRITYYWTLKKSQLLKKYGNIYMLGHGKAQFSGRFFSPSTKIRTNLWHQIYVDARGLDENKGVL